MTTKLSSIGTLIDETVALFHRLRATAELLHGGGELSAARRGVLRSLAREGPQTVPRLASARPVSRQHIQAIVDALAHDGLVNTMPNPAHKRSSLMRLTAEGRATVREIERREAAFFDRVNVSVAVRDLEAATSVLKAVRTSLEHAS